MPRRPPAKRAKKTRREKTQQFEICQYPASIQRQILNKLSPTEFFEFYISSEEARTLVLNNRLKKNERKIYVCFSDEYMWIEIDDEKVLFNCCLDETCREQMFLETPKETVRIDGFTWFKFLENPWAFHGGVFVCDNSALDVNRTVAWLKNLFNTELVFLEFRKNFLTSKYYFEVKGNMVFTESLARMLQGKYLPYSRVSREKKEHFLITMLKNAGLKDFLIKIIRPNKYPISNKPADVARHRAQYLQLMNYLLKLWDKHCGQGVREIYISIAGEMTIDDMFKKIKKITNIEEVLVSEEKINRRRAMDEMTDSFDFCTKTGRPATCQLVDQFLQITMWD